MRKSGRPDLRRGEVIGLAASVISFPYRTTDAIRLDLIAAASYCQRRREIIMSQITTIATWVGIIATFVIVFGGLAHAGHADPEGRVEQAYGAIHGIVIPPFRG
jgi:hypothetical protein